MNIKLTTWCQPDCTVGRLTFENFHCVTLELPWQDNQQDISCIPAGIYDYVKYKSPSKGWVLLLTDVPGREWVEVHAGNFTRQILGCVLVGRALTYLDQDDVLDVTDSKATLEKLLAAVPDHGQIEIERDGKLYTTTEE